jgi:muconolactone delta-isomerase
MKHLVIGTRNLVPMEPATAVGLYQAAKQWTNAQLADGRLDCQYNFVDLGGGCAIVNADSHEEVLERLLDYPLFAFFDWEVKPLADWSHAHDKLIEFFQKLAAMT